MRRFLFTALATAIAMALFVMGSSSEARAVASVFHPELLRALESLDKGEGPEAYGSVDRIWSLWDRADAAHIEEALLGAADNKKLSVEARAYAGMLASFARARRGDQKAAAEHIKALGYVSSFLIVGPFDNEGKAGLDQVFEPEAELASSSPITPGRAYSGKERPVRYRAVANAFPFGWLDASALVRPETKVCIYATTFVKDDKLTRGTRKVRAYVGAGGAFKLFWNGQEALRDEAYRGHDFDRSGAELVLQPGPNPLVLKVCGEDNAPEVSLRLADETGAPDPRLTASIDIADSQKAADRFAANAKKTTSKAPKADAKTSKGDAKSAATKDAKAPAAKKTGPALGPVPLFERLVSVKKPRARDLESYARYLADTNGDDPALHLARDLSQRAADAEPTVERYLLASRLAEDRNQQNEWLNKAEALVKKTGKPSKDLLNARAVHRRNSPNWRDASPIFDRVLAEDPDDVLALAGRVELYNMAGLPRTALGVLEQAVRRSPDSVNLLNMYGSQLRLLGRAADAKEAEERYAMRRFDDGNYLTSMIDLAIARRNRAEAERWIDRLLAAYNGNQWGLGVAARAYRALGQPERATATYKRSLELAPEDVNTLRALAELQGELGRRDEQLLSLREILRIRPQDRDVREYLEHLEPAKPRPDEAYAWSSDKFLKQRFAPAGGQPRRTLRDLTVTTVFDNGLSSQFRQVVFQPLTEPAAAAGRQYGFAYESDRQVVQLRGAKVYRADGKIDEAVEYGEGSADDPSISMYTSARTFYVQFPRLEPGDVVELRYRVDDVTPRNEFGNYFGEIVALQGGEPVSNAEYVLITPKERTFYFDQNIPNLTTSNTVAGNQRIYRFAAKEIPALNPEPAMPPWPEVLGSVHVSTYKNWDDLGRWYWGLVKDQFDLDEETRKLAKKVTEGKTTELDKVKAIYKWVTDNTRYVALEFGIYGYKPRRCVQTVARGWGDCKDKATVIATLLKEVGIPSTIVVTRTRMRGDFRSKIASFAPFDHAIAYVPSLDLYLDGTAEHTGIYELPKMDVGAVVLQVNEGNAKLTRIPEADPEKNFVRRELGIELDGKGSAKLDIDYSTTGYNAASWRDAYGAESTRRERMTRDLGGDFPGVSINEGPQGLVTSDLSNAEEPVKIKVRAVAPGFARNEGDTLSLPVTSGFRLTPNFASLSQRRLPVELIAFTTIDDVYKVKLPPGAKVALLPEERAATSQFGSYSLKVEQAHGEVIVRSKLQVKVSRIEPADYQAWKRFCEEADSAFNVRLLVKP
jgi:tetratricopeptide (TPR) repeat protein/transglutaminase-like putative cysteine protease